MAIPTAYPRPLRAATTFPYGDTRHPIKNLMMQECGYGRYPVMFEFFHGRGGGITLFVAGRKEATAGGHGYDKQGTALSRWFEQAFADDLKAIFDKPKYRKQLNSPHSGTLSDGSRNPWYCVMRNEKTGAISINGMSGLSHVIDLMERTVGLTLRSVGQTKTSSIYLLSRNRKSK